MLGDFVDAFTPVRPFDPAAIEKGAQAVLDTQKAILEATGPITLDAMAILGPPPGWTGPPVKPTHKGDVPVYGRHLEPCPMCDSTRPHCTSDCERDHQC